MCEQWPLLVADFASEYGLRLGRDPLTGNEFMAYVTGLFWSDSRIARHFAPKTP